MAKKLVLLRFSQEENYVMDCLYAEHIKIGFSYAICQ